MKITRTMIAGVVFACTAQHAAAWNAYQTGNSYRHLTAAARTYYLEGQLDGFMMAALDAGNRPYADSIDACIQGVSTDQMQAVVNQQLDKFPERWDSNVSAFVSIALYEFCAKRGTPLKGYEKN